MINRNSELFDLIEAYLENRLEDSALQEFKDRLKTDSDFSEEVEKHRMLHKAMTDDEALQFRKKLIRFENSESNTAMRKTGTFKIGWKVAAIIAVIVGLGIFYFYQNTSSTTPRFENYFKPYPLEDTVRGIQNENFKSALDAYDQGKYDTAIPLLKELIAKMPDADELRLYLGCSYLKMDLTQKALSEFNILTENATYGEQAKWYSAMSYLKLNQKDKTIALLEEIIAFNGIYKSDAIDLYENLRKELNPDDF